MNILHFSQALIKGAKKWGGAERTDETICKAAVFRGHEIKTINSIGMIINWNKDDYEMMPGFDQISWRVSLREVSDKQSEEKTDEQFKKLIDWADLLIFCNIGWFSKSKLIPLIQYAIDKEKKIVF